MDKQADEQQPSQAETFEPLVIQSWSQIKDDLPPLAPVLIGTEERGVLRRGQLMILTGASKAGKSMGASELACAVATGTNWIGLPCKQGRVLYLNLEIQEASADHRIEAVWEQLTRNNDLGNSAENLDILNLRGRAILTAGIGKLCEYLGEAIVEKAIQAGAETLFGFYSLIIFDPFYIVFKGDENSANDVMRELRHFQALAVATGAAVTYVHHHAKGASGGKDSLDRSSGSGVHGRLPEVIADLIEIAANEKTLESVHEQYSPYARPMRLRVRTRDFADPEPIEAVYSYPMHYIAPEELGLANVPDKGRDLGGEKKQEKDEATWAERNLIIALAVDQHPEGIGRTELYRALASTPLGTVSEDTFKGWLKDNRCDFESVEAPPIEGKKKRWLIQRKPGR